MPKKESTGKILKKIPSSELIWVKQITEKGEVFYITSPIARDIYHLYQEVEDGFKLVSANESPPEFDKYMTTKKGRTK